MPSAEEFEISTDKMVHDEKLDETLDIDSLYYIGLMVEIETNFAFTVKPKDFMAVLPFMIVVPM